MVPRRPLPARLAPSSTPTAVPIRASRDSKKCPPRGTLLGVGPHSAEKTRDLTPTVFLSQRGFIAGLYTFLCIQRYFVLSRTQYNKHSLNACETYYLRKSSVAPVELKGSL